MEITRSQLSRSIAVLQTLDKSASPYIGLQWTSTGVAFYRTSDLGYVRSLNYVREQRAMVVSFAHIKNALKAITAETLALEVDDAGMLRMSSTDEYGTSEVRVHTQRGNTAWSKTHHPGQINKQIAPTLFQGVNVKPYSLVTTPFLKHGKLLLITNAGAIIRNQIVESPFPHPREGLLKALSDLEVKTFYMTIEGYWGVITPDFELVVAGHRRSDSMFDLYTTPAEKVGQLPAARFYTALTSATEWSNKEHWIKINFLTGRVETRNAQNDPGEFAFGPPTGWAPVSISAAALENLLETLKQSTEEHIEVWKTTDSVRFTRGLWEAHFIPLT